MDLSSLLADLFALTVNGIKPGLERMEALLAALDAPHERLLTIHVAGTNGKGSTCAMLASILRHAGYRVGVYSSPHIHTFNERISVQGALIDDADIARLAAPLVADARQHGWTFFEVTTAMAFRYFAERRVDVAVIETGLGGRLDATNVITPLVSVITSIDIDHVEYLGPTLDSIASEKAGIIKPGVPAVVGEPRLELRPVFQQRADAVGAPLTFVDDVVHVTIDRYHDDGGMTVNVLGQESQMYYTTDLAGRHQARNIGTVLATLPVLRNTFFVDDDHIRTGLASVRTTTGLQGRIQTIPGTPPVVVDVAHNAAGIAALVRTLRDRRWTDGSAGVVIGAMADKDLQAMMTAIAPLAAAIYPCAAATPRAASAEAIRTTAVAAGLHVVPTDGTVAGALAQARHDGRPVLVCGSFSVAQEALAVLVP